MKNAISDFIARLTRFIHETSSPDGAYGPVSAEKSDSAFNNLALELFSWQFAHTTAYRCFCESIAVTPCDVDRWDRIPAVPTTAFKEWDLTSLEAGDRTKVFHSSGSTAQRSSRHFHDAESLDVYEVSALQWFKAHVLPGGSEATTMIFLSPSPALAPHSSLVHMFEAVRREFGSSHSLFTGATDTSGAWIIDFDKTLTAFEQAAEMDNPIVVLGTAFNFVHLFDFIEANHLRLQLPDRSRVLETGGYKGRSRAVPKAALHALMQARLGVASSHIICEYGMSELSSQAYDWRPPFHESTSPTLRRVFHFPPWARAQIISPETGIEVGEGETGLIRVFDLANVRSVLAVQTEDLAVRRGDGFELLGRAALAEPRGCSLLAAT